MTVITRFQALTFDVVAGQLADTEVVDCKSPVAAIQTAQGQWKVFGHAGAVALSRTSSFGQAKPTHKHVLRRFGSVPDAYLREDIDE